MKKIGTYRERIYTHYTSEKMASWREFSETDYHHWSSAARVRLKGWLPENKNAACLDLGCGPGNVLYLLSHEGYRNICGVDVSPEQIEVAKRVCANVTCADVKDYLASFKENFELIIAFDLIEHFQKDELLELLDVVRKTLKPGGTLILQTPNAESPWGLSMRYGDFTHESAFTPHSLEHILGISGFTTFEARECKPHIHGVKSLMRAIIWKGIWLALALWNLAETGNLGSGIYTRVFLAKTRKPLD